MAETRECFKPGKCRNKNNKQVGHCRSEVLFKWGRSSIMSDARKDQLQREEELFSPRSHPLLPHLERGNSQEPFCNRNNFISCPFGRKSHNSPHAPLGQAGEWPGCSSPALRAYHFFLNVFWTRGLSSTKG